MRHVYQHLSVTLHQEGFPLLLVSLLVVRNLNFDLFCPSVLCLPFIDFVIDSFSSIGLISSYPWRKCVLMCTGLVLLTVLAVSFFVSRILDLLLVVFLLGYPGS